MTTIQAGLTYYKQVNEKVREAAEKDDSITIQNVIGQRYIGCGSSGKNITVHGTPGNGLGQYLNGSTLEVFGNAQEAVGDTMNEGDIIIHGNVGDACGYGMRGGRIFIEGDCGYRGGIHMKAYQEHFPSSSSAARQAPSSANIRRAALSSCSASARTARIRSTISAERVCTAAKLC